MPQLKQLSCTIQWANTGAPFEEYGTVYGDGLVESFIAVPHKPQPFTIRLTSLAYIYEGLSMIVFIDGKYQANRNRVNLKPTRKNRPLDLTQIDFLLRQREKPLGEGVYMGREWRFDDHNIVDDLPDGVKETHFDLLGTIEILVLRCRARVPEEIDESGCSSAADSDALGEKGKRIVLDDDIYKPSNKDGPAEPAQDVEVDYVNLLAGPLFGCDGTNEGNHLYGLDGSGSSFRHPNWPYGLPANALHNRGHSFSQPSVPHATQSQNMNSSQQTSFQAREQHATPNRKHVRFNLGSQPLVSDAPPHVGLNTHNGSQQSTYVPHAQGVHTHALPPQQHNSSMPIYGPPPFHSHQYKQQHAPLYSVPMHPVGHLPQPPSNIPYRPPPQPYIVSSSHFPHHLPHPPYWPVQPPHLMFNPYRYPQGAAWLRQPGINTAYIPQSASSATMANPINGPNTGTNNDQQVNQNDQSTASAWDNWNNGSNNNGVQNNNAINPDNWAQNSVQNNSGGNDWNENGSNSQNVAANQQNNGNMANWQNNGLNSSDNNKNADWATSNTNGANDGWPNVTDNNIADNNGWNNDNNANNNGANNDWANENNDNNNSGAPNGDWNDKDAWPSSRNEMTDDMVLSRALFGPHGQYYTYIPQGPDQPMPDAEEEPRYDIPKRIAEATGSTKQVLSGSGYMYLKRRRAPEYIDTLAEPYARFVFKYRTKDQLEKEIGVNIEVEPNGDEAIQQFQRMEKQDLVDMLVRAKSALGGKIPSPALKPATPSIGAAVPIPVDPPEHTFLKYKLPELRQPMTNLTNNEGNIHGSAVSTKGRRRSGASAGSQNNWNGDNNDNSWDAGGGTNGNTTNKKMDWESEDPSKKNYNWNRAWDGAAERNNGWNNTSSNLNNFNAQNDSLPHGQVSPRSTINDQTHVNDPSHWNQTTPAAGADWTQTTEPRTADSSPSTLPLNEAFNSTIPPISPLPPSVQPWAQQNPEFAKNNSGINSSAWQTGSQQPYVPNSGW